MKILYVYGDDDYAALTFVDNFHFDTDEQLKRLYSEAINNGGEVVVDEGEGIYCQALEFGDVDPKFIDWIKSGSDFIDYDTSKNKDFFIVEE